ncbi:MAG: Rieske 2Fe-2S domain-containing protein [Qingshengfaniella sp.]
MSNDWIPVALSDRLRPGGVMRSFVGGHERVVWRSAAGKVAAWDNRCPHRGMRLSHGFVRGEQLACLYHGWHYGADGGCSYIPAHPDLEPPKTVCATVFPCVEADGLIWVAPAAEAPAQPPTGVVGGMTAVRSLYLECPAGVTLAALQAAGAASQGALLSVTPGATTGPIWLALQASGAAQSVLHIGAPAGTPPEQLTAISRWAERMRRSAETQGQEAA